MTSPISSPDDSLYTLDSAAIPTTKVDKHSPPRFLVKGAESGDSSDEEPRSITEQKVRELIEQKKVDPNSFSIEAIVKFKMPFGRKGHIVQPLSYDPEQCTIDSPNKRVVLKFFSGNLTTFFSFNHEGRYSSIKIVLRERETKQVQTLEKYSLFVPLQSDSDACQIRSLNGRLVAKLNVLSQKEFEELKGARRRLFSEEDEGRAEPKMAISAIELNSQLQFGALLKIEELSARMDLT
jgi:hypothetical protein